MKKTTLILLLFTSLLNAQQNAQRHFFKLGLKEGGNTSQVSGDTYTGFDKYGYVGGAYIKTKISKKIDFGFEIIYIQKGSRHRADFSAGDYTNYFLQLDYVEVPLIVSYNHRDTRFEIGPSVGLLVKEKELITEGGLEHQGTRPFNNLEYILNIGVGYRFYSRFGLNLRYSNSIISVRRKYNTVKSYTGSGQYNSLISLCLTYEYDTKTKKKN